MSTLRLLINGSRGRMGRALTACANEDQDFEIAALIDVGDDFAAAVPKCDAVVDFSHHSSIELVLARCVENRRPLVIGTTGHSEAQVACIQHASAQIPVVLSANYSTGVNMLFWLTRKAAEVLGKGYDVEVMEMHHNAKKDAPSGTAKRLAEILAAVRGLTYIDDVVHGRRGNVGERSKTEIGMHAIRGGDVVGDHTVIFAGPGERVELTHKASGRETFARGALRAVRWVAGRAPGLYDMQDVLGLK